MGDLSDMILLTEHGNSVVYFNRKVLQEPDVVRINMTKFEDESLIHYHVYHREISITQIFARRMIMEGQHMLKLNS